MKIYKDMLLLLILSLVLIGGINDINQAKKQREQINISTNKGNFKFKNDKEFIEFMEGWSN